MRAQAREVYAWLRRRPVVGVAVSRLVWAAKGLMGRPVAIAVVAPPEPPPRRASAARPLDVPVRIALEAAEALQVRVAALERSTAVAQTVAAPARAPPAGPPVSWSVVIPTLDRATWLDRALWALAYQRHPAFEVIVVRGPCRDDTDAVLARHAARIRVLACPQANIAAARNLGLQIARGEAVAFLDDDAVPEPDWLERLGEALRDRAVGGVGGFIRDASGVAFQCRTVVADRFGASRDVGARTPRLDPPGPGATRYLSLTGANCGFRRQALLDIGGFDEAYAYFLDETDVCLRLVEAGWRLAVAPEAEVHHGYAESVQRDAAGAPRRLFDCVRSTAYFALRHGAPHHGLAAAADRLDAYAAGLVRDTAWRQDAGRVLPQDAARMLDEIETGLAEGARQALSGPPRRLREDGGRVPLAQPDAPRLATPVVRAPVLRPSRKRLRLALLCQDYPGLAPPERPPGGIAVWSQALAEALARRGHELSVFARAAGPAPSVVFTAIGDGGLWLHRTPPGGARARDAVLAAAPSSIAAPAAAQAREVLRVTARRRFDLALGPVWGLEPAALIGSAAFPVAVSLHTACAQIAADRPDWSAAYRRTHVDKVIAAERRLLATAPHLLANSAGALADLAAELDLPELAGRAVVIPHGLPDLARGVAPWPRPPGLSFLFVGRLERRKGIDTLLDAAPQVLSAEPAAHLTIVGEETGSLGETSVAVAFLARHAGAPWLDRVTFTGPLPRADLLARYAACDVVLMPSRYESFGLVALEAMIFAKPCIVGDAGGLRDLVVEGETGLRVAPGEVAALVRAMLALAASPERRAAMGAAGRRRYAALYTDLRMAEAFEAWAWELAAHARLPLAAE